MIKNAILFIYLFIKGEENGIRFIFFLKLRNCNTEVPE